MAAGKNPKRAKNLSEERLKSVLQLSSDWYWEQDKNLRFTLFSGKNLGEAGFDSASLIGKTRWEIPGASFEPDERAALQAKLDARAPFIDHEYERAGADGIVQHISASGMPVFDAAGRFGGYRGIAKDITERKRAEELQDLEHSVARRIAAAESVTAAMTAVIRAICEMEGWECGRYFRVDEEAGELRFEQSWGVPEPGIRQFLERSNQRSSEIVNKPGVGLMGQVWQSGQPLWVPDVTKDTRSLRPTFAADFGIRGGFVFPVISEGKTIGVLAFNSLQVRAPDERLLKAILAIGSQIGQFLERKRAEEEQRQFRAAMDVSADGLMLIDRATLRFVDANHTACEMLGYSRQELLQVGPAEVAQVDRLEIGRAYDKMIATGATSKQVHARHLRKDGTWFPAEVSRRALRSDGGWLIVTSVRDITERLAAEESLRRFRVAMDNSADMIVLIDRATMQFVDMNETACRLLGYSREELLKMGPQDVLPTSREDLERAYDRFIEDPSHTPGMHSHYRRKDGSTFPFESTRRVLRSGDGYIIAAISRDISARIAAEEDLLRFRAALDTSADMIMLVDRATMRYVDVNATACEKQGYTREEMLKLGPQDVSPVDRETLERAYDESIATGRTTELQSIHRRKDGTQIPVEVFRRAVRTGERWIIVAIVRDISERKRAEQLLALEHTVTRSLAEADSAAAALKAAIHAVCETEGWECGRYYLVDEKADMLRFGEAWGIPDSAIQQFIEQSRESVYRPGAGLMGKAWQSGQPMWVADVAKDPRALPVGLGIRSGFFFPILAEGKTIGMLAFNSRHVREPEDRLLQAMLAIGSQVGQYLQRKQAEDVVRESEERFRSLTDLSSDMYWEQDDQLRFTAMTGTGLKRVNTRSFRPIGKKRWEQNYINMTADQWSEHIAALEAHRPFRDLELCRLDDTGNKVWIGISGEPVFDAAGTFKGYRGVGKDITERKHGEERIQFLADHDSLTALPNRAMFGEALSLAIENARRYSRDFAVLFIDLDRFKVINDTLGHEAGDSLLQEMGIRLTHTIRAGDVVARLGGDEFVVLVQEVSEPEQVAAVARKILSALVKPMVVQGQECRVSASIGICMFPSEAQDETALMKNADIAMYRAKEDGKNNYKFYTKDAVAPALAGH